MVKNENRKIAAGAWQTYDKKCSNQTKKRRKHLIGSVWKRGVNWITFLLDCSCKACNWKIQWNPLRGYSFFYLSHSHLIQLFCVDSPIHSDAQTDFISLSLSLLLLWCFWADGWIWFSICSRNAFRLCFWVWKLFIVRKLHTASKLFHTHKTSWLWFVWTGFLVCYVFHCCYSVKSFRCGGYCFFPGDSPSKLWASTLRSREKMCGKLNKD